MALEIEIENSKGTKPNYWRVAYSEFNKEKMICTVPNLLGYISKTKRDEGADADAQYADISWDMSDFDSEQLAVAVDYFASKWAEDDDYVASIIADTGVESTVMRMESVRFDNIGQCANAVISYYYSSTPGLTPLGSKEFSVPYTDLLTNANMVAVYQYASSYIYDKIKNDINYLSGDISKIVTDDEGNESIVSIFADATDELS